MSVLCRQFHEQHCSTWHVVHFALWNIENSMPCWGYTSDMDWQSTWLKIEINLPEPYNFTSKESANNSILQDSLSMMFVTENVQMAKNELFAVCLQLFVLYCENVFMVFAVHIRRHFSMCLIYLRIKKRTQNQRYFRMCSISCKHHA